MKSLLYLSCIVISTIASAQQMNSDESHNVKFFYHTYESSFVWKGMQKGKLWDNYATLLIPVTVDNKSQIFYMQFDTGSPFSMLYSEKLNYIQKIDTLSKSTDFNFKIGDKKITIKNISIIRNNMKKEIEGQGNLQIIGTIGTDILNNRTLLIDYLKKKVVFMDSIPENLLKRIKFSMLIYQQGSILLPSVIQGKNKTLYFDTGSSGFELLTDQTTWLKLAAKDSTRTTYEVKSWSKMLTANTVATHDSIQISTQNLPLNYVTYMEGASDSQINRMMALGIGGMTGNKLFINSVLVIDAKNKRFGFLDK